MVSVVVIDTEGKGRTVNGNIGLSVMEILRNHGFDDLIAQCGGCCSCATCHVYLDPIFENALPSMSSDEDGLLQGLEHRKANSRLACQIKVTDAMDGIKVTIAPEG